jgi:hypothetical protein
VEGKFVRPAKAFSPQKNLIGRLFMSERDDLQAEVDSLEKELTLALNRGDEIQVQIISEELEDLQGSLEELKEDDEYDWMRVNGLCD